MVRNNPIRWRDNNGLLTEEQINMYVNLFSNIGLKNDDELKSELLKYGLSEEEQNQIYLNMLRPMQSGSSSSLFSVVQVLGVRKVLIQVISVQ